MDKGLAKLVRDRAGAVCEYCHVPERLSGLRHVIDHIIAQQHRGPTAAENLACCCVYCNLSKGPNIAGLDPEDDALTRLFHPRNDRWNDHFKMNNGTIIGMTPIDRTTVYVLDFNEGLRVAVRRSLVDEGEWPFETP